MVQIALVRPGTNDYIDQGRIQGTLAVPMNQRGADEVSALVEQLRPLNLAVIYTSDSEPALGTSRALALALGVRLKKLDHMQNVDHGLWQGLCVDEIRRKHPRIYRQWQEDPDTVCPPHGEMLPQARERVRGALARLLRKHGKQAGCVGLVVPEPLASLVRCELQHTAVGDLWKAAGEHATWELIEIEPRSPVQVS